VNNPYAGEVLPEGSPLAVGGVATGKGMPEPTAIENVTVEVDNNGAVAATLTLIPDHHPHGRNWVPAWTFQADVVIPDAVGEHTIRVSATDDSGAPAGGAWVPIVAAGFTFTGTATFRTDYSDAVGPFPFDLLLGATFSTDRRTVNLINFPVLKTDAVTVTLISEAKGTFDPNSGNMNVPVDLLFHPSSSFASDSTLSLVLTTGQTPPQGPFSDQGQPMQADGSILLVADGVFQGGTPLGGNAASLTIAGAFTPHP
jgi:hypothetical protein